MIIVYHFTWFEQLNMEYYINNTQVVLLSYSFLVDTRRYYNLLSLIINLLLEIMEETKD